MSPVSFGVALKASTSEPGLSMRAEITPRSLVSIFRSFRAGTIRVTSFLNLHRRIETMDYANAAAGDVMMEFNTNGLQTGAEMVDSSGRRNT
jgi:hypothetical protein